MGEKGWRKGMKVKSGGKAKRENYSDGGLVGIQGWIVFVFFAF
jgi:hypothetical protein